MSIFLINILLGCYFAGFCNVPANDVNDCFSLLSNTYAGKYKSLSSEGMGFPVLLSLNKCNSRNVFRDVLGTIILSDSSLDNKLSGRVSGYIITSVDSFKFDVNFTSHLGFRGLCKIKFDTLSSGKIVISEICGEVKWWGEGKTFANTPDSGYLDLKRILN